MRCLTPGLAVAAVMASATSVFAMPLAKGPYLQDLTARSVVIRGETAPPAALSIEVRTQEGKGDPVVVKDSASAFHSVGIPGLAPRTRYAYRVIVGGLADVAASGTFTTAPEDATPFTFLVYGDDRSGDEAHAAVVRTLLDAPSDFLLHTGDFVEDGTDKDAWRRFFDIEASLIQSRCVFACVGNHELLEPGGGSFLRYFGPSTSKTAADADLHLYRSFRWSDARFFLLNGMDSFTTSGEKEWLRGELERADSEPGLVWRFVVVHHGPWSSGPHGKNSRLLEAGIPELLAQHKVDLIWSGHDHIYERGEQSGLRYVVSGGGGAPLYKIAAKLPSTRRVEAAYHFVEASVSPERVSLVVKRVDGSLLEKCGFTKTSADWDCDGTAASPPSTSSSSLAAPPSGEGTRPHPARCGCTCVGRAVGTSVAGFLAVALAASLGALRRRSRG